MSDMFPEDKVNETQISKEDKRKTRLNELHAATRIKKIKKNELDAQIIEKSNLLDFNSLWTILEKDGWWSISVNDHNDPVYAAMNFFSTVYINVAAKDIWNLNCLFNNEIINGFHYFERYLH